MSYKDWKEKQQNPAQKKKIVTFDCVDQSTNANIACPTEAQQAKQNVVNFNQTIQPSITANPIDQPRGRQPHATDSMLFQQQQQPQQNQYFHPDSNPITNQNLTVDDMFKLLTLQQNMQSAVKVQAENIPPQPVPVPAQKQNVELQDLFNLMLQMQQQSLQSQNNPVQLPMMTQNSPEVKEVVVRQNQTPKEPTTRDLVNIILRQQEQLTNLQNQVHALVRAISSNPPAAINQMNRSAPKPMSVMTSLEINVQNIHNKKSPLDRRIIDSQPPALYEEENENENKENRSCHCQSKFQPEEENIPETNFIRRKNSTEAFNANMNAATPQATANPPGLTLYGNILNQVNDVLQNSPPTDPNRVQQLRPDQQQTTQSNDRNNYVASAQFKQFGFQFDDVNMAATSKR